MFKRKMFEDCSSWKITGISGFHEPKAALEKENICICTAYSGKGKGYWSYN